MIEGDFLGYQKVTAPPLPAKAKKFIDHTISALVRMLISVYKILSMKHEFTQLQLTRLVYGETSKAETDMLLELVLSVPQMAKTLETLSTAKKALETVEAGPTDLTINRIMAYSAANAPVSAS